MNEVETLEQRKKDVLNKLDSYNGEYSEICVRRGRYIAYARFASTWGTMIKTTPEDTYRVLLAITLLLAIIFLSLEVLRYYLVVRKARKLHALRNDNKINDGEAIALMNETSDFTFTLMAIQLLLLAVMVIALGIYYVKTLSLL